MPTPIPLDADAFVAALRGLSDQYWANHPFHARLHRGELSPDAVRTWVANRWYYQKSLPQKDAAIIANCPLPEIRRKWVERIAFHDGRAEGEGGIAEWIRLAEAVGLRADEVRSETHVVPAVRSAADDYVSFARNKPWPEAVASSLTEMFAPDLMRERVRILQEQYTWINPEGLRYFNERIVEARKESDFALRVVIEHCTTREQQEAAVAALSFKCSVLWRMLDAIEKAAG